MFHLSRRSVLASGTVLALTPFSGCQFFVGEPPGDPGEVLDEPHQLRLEEVREDPSDAFPIELTYEFTDTRIAEGDPASFRVTLRNTGDRPVTIEADPPWPFGVPFLLLDDTDEFQRVTAWNDAFEESDHLTTRDRAVVSWEEVFVHDEIDAGETITETYEIYHDSYGLSAGTFRSWVGARGKDEHTADSYTIFFEKIVIEPSAEA